MATLTYSASTSGTNLTVAGAWQNLYNWAYGGSNSAGSPTSSPNLSAQGLSIQATTPSATLSVTLGLAWVVEAADGGTPKVIKYKAGTAVATSRRTGKDNASGDYVCDVTFDSVANGVVDLQPFGEDPKVAVYIGVTAVSAGTLSSSSTLDFQLHWTRAI